MTIRVSEATTIKNTTKQISIKPIIYSGAFKYPGSLSNSDLRGIFRSNFKNNLLKYTVTYPIVNTENINISIGKKMNNKNIIKYFLHP